MKKLINLLAMTMLASSGLIKNVDNTSTLSNSTKTNWDYNGEKDPDYSQIDPSDWDEWCAINSEYTKGDSGYKNRYRKERAEYNYGICPTIIDSPVVQIVGSDSYSSQEGAVVLTASGDFWRNIISSDTRLKPVKINGFKDISLIASSSGSILALDKYGELWGMGNSVLNGTGVIQSIPIEIGLENITSIVGGSRDYLALTSDGEVFSWGSGLGGIGNGTSNGSNTPVNISKITSSPLYGKTIKKIASGSDYSFVIDENNSLYAWSNNQYGQLGLGSSSSGGVLMPVQVTTIQNIVEVYIANSSTTFVKTSSGKVHGVGRRYNRDQFGLGGSGTTLTWTEIPWLDDVKLITAKYSTTALYEDGRVVGTGTNTYGQLGLENTTNQSLPIELNWKNVVTIDGSPSTLYHLDTTGAVYTSGSNRDKTLGINLPSNTPEGGEVDIDAVSRVTIPVKMIQSPPSYMSSSAGKVSAHSKDNYKFIYTAIHPNKASALAASPIRLTSQNQDSERYHEDSTITHDDYEASDDFYSPSVGGEYCDDSGNCETTPEIRDPDLDQDGPNFNDKHDDWNGSLPENYLLAAVKPVTFSASEGSEVSSSGVKVTINNGATSSARYVYINKLGQNEYNLVILIEIYKINTDGTEELIKTEHHREAGDFVIKTSEYRGNNANVKIRFRSYRDVDSNKDDDGKIKYYSAERYFISTKYSSGLSMPIWLIVLISAIIVGAGIIGGTWFIKTRRKPERY